jgi:flagellar biosynthesis/type III secretory pathway chaperone
MIDSLPSLIAALREELKSYGELLALLDRQQDLVFARTASELFESVGAVQTQAPALEQARRWREVCREEVARELSCAPATPFKDLIPQLPADYRPLVQALVQENNELLVRVQQRARQNHLLLSRSVELMQKFLGSLLPGRDILTYTEVGRSRGGALPASVVYNAVG